MLNKTSDILDVLEGYMMRQGTCDADDLAVLHTSFDTCALRCSIDSDCKAFVFAREDYNMVCSLKSTPCDDEEEDEDDSESTTYYKPGNCV